MPSILVHCLGHLLQDDPYAKLVVGEVLNLGIMDKFRALEYFVAAARHASFAGAARQLGVTTVAITKSIATLEAHCSARLFERSPTGVRLTLEGEHYLEACQPALDQLQIADEQLKRRAHVIEGQVVIGAYNVAARHIISPALAEFRQRLPRIQLELRDFAAVRLEDYDGADLFIMSGWNGQLDLVQKAPLQSNFWVVAAPQYWARHGRPQHPTDLAKHDCLLLGGQGGTLMDKWRFRHDAKGEVQVTVNGSLAFSNAHRDTYIDAALNGYGVVRSLDWALRNDVNAGRLVRVLTDWHIEEAPPVLLLYRPSARSVPRIRAVVDFFEAVMTRMNVAGEPPRKLPLQPDWGTRGYRRSSQHVTRDAKT